VRLPVGEPLALCALDCAFCASFIVHAKARAVILAKIEFGQVARQMLFPNVLIGADKAALEDAEIAFRRVRMDNARLALRT